MLKGTTPCANRNELYVGLLKEAIMKCTRESNSPMVLWDYAIEHVVLIHSTVHHPHLQAQGKKPHEFTFGNQSNISNVCNFGWCEWAHCRDHGSFP